MSKQSLDSTAQQCASATVIVGFVEKVFHNFIDLVVMKKGSDQG